MWNLPAPPGFQGLHPDKTVTSYMRHLPHWRQNGATYFVTFRLGDSLPQSKLDELEQVRREWEQRHVGRFCKPSNEKGRFTKPSYSNNDLEELTRETMRRIEQWLDQGMGSCRLRERAAAKHVVDAMHFFDGERYELDCYVVMPNHVHAVVRPLKCADEPLERILQSWKRHSSSEINRLCGLTGHLWQQESFDRIIRDEEHLWRVLQYIGTNPSRAGLTSEQYVLWLRPQWIEFGWKFE